MAGFSIEVAFEAAEIRMGDEGYFEDRDCYYRVVRGDVQVGVRASFDRFANSVDFVFAVPVTCEAFSEVMGRLKRAIREGRYDPRGGNETRL